MSIVDQWKLIKKPETLKNYYILLEFENIFLLSKYNHAILHKEVVQLCLTIGNFDEKTKIFILYASFQ